MKNAYLKAFLGGLVIGTTPAFFIALIEPYLSPNFIPEGVKILSDFLKDGIGTQQIVFFLTIALIMPVVEELLFRGLLWKLLAWKLSPKLTWILVSVLFAMVHQIPLRIVCILPFSFFIGWLRLKTGKLGPSILAHMTNNTMVCVLMTL